MRLLVLGLCALFLGLPGYGQNELKADLSSTQRDAGFITIHLLRLAEQTHEPARNLVATFARDLVTALGSRTVERPAVNQLVADMDGVFKSAGTSTLGFYDRIASFESTLGTLGVQRIAAHKLALQLETIGKQVRGPEDTPVRPAPARMR